jgi:hypothetical protein
MAAADRAQPTFHPRGCSWLWTKDAPWQPRPARPAPPASDRSCSPAYLEHAPTTGPARRPCCQSRTRPQHRSNRGIAPTSRPRLPGGRRTLLDGEPAVSRRMRASSSLSSVAKISRPLRSRTVSRSAGCRGLSQRPGSPPATSLRVRTCGRLSPHAGPCQRFARNCATHDLAPPHARSSLAPFACAVVRSREVLHGGVNPRRIDGMQGVRGSNPLSSTPGQRPKPELAVSRSPGSSSRSAAIRAALADPVVQRGDNPGRRRRLETVTPGRRREPWPCNESPDRSGHGRSIQAGATTSSLSGIEG